MTQNAKHGTVASIGIKINLTLSATTDVSVASAFHECSVRAISTSVTLTLSIFSGSFHRKVNYRIGLRFHLLVFRCILEYCIQKGWWKWQILGGVVFLCSLELVYDLSRRALKWKLGDGDILANNRYVSSITNTLPTLNLVSTGTFCIFFKSQCNFISFIINFWSYLRAGFLTETLAGVWFLAQSISEVF